MALAKVREGWLVWGWIGVFFQVFSCRELLFYCAVARLHSGVQGKDWASRHGGDGQWMVMEQGLNMGKAVDGLCLHGYMLFFGLGRGGWSSGGDSEGQSTAKCSGVERCKGRERG